MSLRSLFILLALGAIAQADLNTGQYITIDGNGSGRFDGDITGVNALTIYDEPGIGDMWNDGDQFQYVFDDQRKTESFTATVRVVSQTEAIDGRWGKAGIRASRDLSGNSAYAMAQVYSGNGSQVDPPDIGEHSPVPVRLGGRQTHATNGSGFEIPMQDPLTGADVPNNVFPFTEDVPAPANAAWLRLSYSAASGSFWGSYAEDDNGTPVGPWALSDIRQPDVGDEGVILGLAYSAHNDIDASFDEHGITFDNFSVGPLVKRAYFVGGVDTITDEFISGVLDVERGPDETVPGLAQEWIDGNFRNNPEGLESATPLNDAPFTTDPTWFGGSQNLPGAHKYPQVPELAGTKFDGNPGDVNDYAVRFKGQIKLSNGDYLIRDGIDDYTMVRIDLDGDGQFSGELLPAPGESNGANDEVVIHDDAWNDLDGEGGGLPTADEEGFFTISGANGEEWRDIEVWMGEAGGGDGAVLYLTREESPDADNWPIAGFSAAQQAEYMIGNDMLQATVPGPILSGKSIVTLDEGLEYNMTVSSSRLDSDKIIVEDPGGDATTAIDLSDATVRLHADGELVPGDEFVLFVADELIGVEDFLSNSIIVPEGTEGQWDFSGLSEGGPDGHRILFRGTNNVVGDCNGDGVANAEDLACACAAGNIDEVLAATGLLAGDLNGDGKVDFPDFLVLSTNFNEQVDSYTEGDIDCDGTVAFADFLVLSTNFNKSSGEAAASVPEPATLSLLGLAGLMLGCLRRRRVR